MNAELRYIKYTYTKKNQKKQYPTPHTPSHHTLPAPSRYFICPLTQTSSPQAPTNLLNPSLTLSLSTALLLATSPGATCTPAKPGTHSLGSTALSTSASALGRAARWRERRMAIRERARRRETAEVRGWTMERATRSERVGRAGEVRRGVTIARLARRRWVCRRGFVERWRRWWFT